MVISPTPGRIVWFYPDPNAAESGFVRPPDGEPCAAIVAMVHSDHKVNLTVFDAAGRVHPRSNVTLAQEPEIGGVPGGAYCAWMPYQVGQAKAAKPETIQPVVAVAAGDSSASGGVFGPIDSIRPALTDGDAAADLAGTQRPDNPTIVSGGAGDFGGAGAEASWSGSDSSSSSSDSSSSSSSSDSGSCSSSSSSE